MEIGRVQAGPYEFFFNAQTTEVFVEQYDEEWEIEIYKFKHFLGSMEIDAEGKLYISEDFGLHLEKTSDYSLEVK